MGFEDRTAFDNNNNNGDGEEVDDCPPERHKAEDWRRTDPGAE